MAEPQPPPKEEDPQYDEELVKQGANARALGRTEFDNPFYRPENMPAKTGETVDVWLKKSQAWGHGWFMENMMRMSRNW